MAFLLGGILLVLLSGCESISYYHQAISGQLYILTHRQQIKTLLNAADTSPHLKAQLEVVNELRDFAQNSLQLPATMQFTTYVDVQRPYVIWNVFAAEEFSTTPVSWCYPVAGCVTYRGYFSKPAAVAKADKLKQQGYEVYTGGVTAYSTLGWFSDPVLNTVINRETWQLASLLFHELAHQVVYARADTQFNESFATAVEQEGLRRWINANFNRTDTEQLLATIKADVQRQEQFVSLIQAVVADLTVLYQSDLAPDVMREKKQQRLQLLRTQYQQQKQAWGGYSAYDAWFSGDLNNAQLTTVATYNNLVPAFTALLQACEADLPCFYAQVQKLAKLPEAQRKAMLLAGISP